MRRLHLIPIVRIATQQKDSIWEKPNPDDIKNWVFFLNSLNWVIKNRYVIIGNEPNHATEWGGELNPEEYTDYLISFSKQLKEASDDFFVLPAALDASAPDNKTHMKESTFLNKMYEYNTGVFNYIDALNSHSYPNPDFSGSEKDTGAGSIKTYEWELNFLKGLGVEKQLKVFITETGWAHNQDGQDTKYKDIPTISKSLTYAYTNVWNDEKIVAVTPFVLGYQDKPFDIFSWKKKGGGFYDFYYEVQKLSKKQGSPKQITAGEIVAVLSPQIIKRGDKFYGLAVVKNKGQTIWKKGAISLIKDKADNLEIEPFFFSEIEPGQIGFIFFRVTSSNAPQESLQASIKLAENGLAFGNSYRFQVEIYSEPEQKQSLLSLVKDYFSKNLQKLLL